MTIYSADFTVGRRGRNAVLTDESGAAVLQLWGSGAVRDEDGHLGWSTQASIRNVVKDAVSWGALGNPALDLKRSRRVAKGGPLIWATLEHPDRWHYEIKAHDDAYAGLSFGPLDGLDGLPADPDEPSANSELLAQGAPIARCWPTVGKNWELAGARYEVASDLIGLPEIVLLFHARYQLWHPLRDKHTFQWRAR
jgi:hypothetical protein